MPKTTREQTMQISVIMLPLLLLAIILVTPTLAKAEGIAANTDNNASSFVELTPPSDKEPATVQAQTPGEKPANQPAPFNHAPCDKHTRNHYWQPPHMQRDMNRRFNRPYRRFDNQPDFQYFHRERISAPEMDIKEDEYQYMVRINMRDIDRGNISFNLDDQILTIKGMQKHKKRGGDEAGNVVYSVRQSSRFKRSITLEKPIKQNEVRTHISSGALTIIIPKEIY